jgi:hypothetical protein
MKDKLVITLSPGRKLPKSKIGRVLYRIWFRVWYIWRLDFLAFFYSKLADFFFLFLPREEREKILSEMEDFNIEIHYKEGE